MVGNLNYGSKTIDWEDLDHSKVEEILKWETSGSILPCRSAIDTLSQSNMDSISSNPYLNLLNKHLEKRHNINTEDNALLFIANLPLLNLAV